MTQAPVQFQARPLSSSTRARRLAPYLFISPFFIFFLVFALFPTLFSFYLSFQKWRQTSGLGEMKFSGLENYHFTLFSDPWFWKAVGNTLILGVYGLLLQPIALVLAFAILVGLKRFRSLVTALYFLPYITSTVAVALIFTVVYSKNTGLLNAFLSTLHGLPLVGGLFPNGGVDWLGDPNTVKPAIALVVLWRYLGWNVLLHLSRMQAIPQDLYDAAKIDGASTGQQFRFVTLPQLMPMLFLTVSLTIIGQMQLFDEPYVLVGGEGGWAQAGLTVATYLYTTAFKFGDAGTAAAMGWILFAGILALSTLNNRIFGAQGRARGE